MKELILFRIFALFPLIGILIPDVANLMYGVASTIPAAHIIVEISLLLCISIVSVGIWIAEFKGFKIEVEGNVFSINLDPHVLEKAKGKAKKFAAMSRRHRKAAKKPAALETTLA